MIDDRMENLARNLSVAGLLCLAHSIGRSSCPCDGRSAEWEPGCRWRWSDPSTNGRHVVGAPPWQMDGNAAAPSRLSPLPGYESLAAIHDEALAHAQSGKGIERHSSTGEAFADQQIVQLGEWMNSTAFAIGQACKKSLESTRLPPERARAELLGSINYLSAAVIQIDRSTR